MATDAKSAPAFALPFINDRSQTRYFASLGVAMDLIATSGETGSLFEAIDCIFPAGCEMPLHRHERSDELLFIIEGTLAIRTEAGTETVSVGAFACFPRGAAHAFANRTFQPVRTLTVWSPCLGEGAEEVFAALASVPSGNHDLSALASLLASHDMHLVAPLTGTSDEGSPD